MTIPIHDCLAANRTLRHVPLAPALPSPRSSCIFFNHQSVIFRIFLGFRTVESTQEITNSAQTVFLNFCNSRLAVPDPLFCRFRTVKSTNDKTNSTESDTQSISN